MLGNETAACKGSGEFRFRRCKADIRIKRHDEAEPCRRSVDRCDDRFLNLQEIAKTAAIMRAYIRSEAACKIKRLLAPAWTFLPLARFDLLKEAHIGPCAETPARAGEHDDTDIIVSHGGGHGALHASFHRARPGIQPVRPVEREHRYAALHLAKQVFIFSHFLLPLPLSGPILRQV